MRSKVKLFYNDYNTYLVSDDIVTMIKFVNQNGKICDGVGMQSHLDVHWPDANYIGNTIDKFKNAGFEIQITELDATINAMQSRYTLQFDGTYFIDCTWRSVAKSTAKDMVYRWRWGNAYAYGGNGRNRCE